MAVRERRERRHGPTAWTCCVTVLALVALAGQARAGGLLRQVQEVEVEPDGRLHAPTEPVVLPAASTPALRSSAEAGAPGSGDAEQAKAMEHLVEQLNKYMAPEMQVKDAPRKGDKESASVQATAALTSALLSPLIPAIQAAQKRLPGVWSTYAWGGIFELLFHEPPLCCSIYTIIKYGLVNIPPTLGHLTSMKKPVNPDGTLPRPLKNLSGQAIDHIDAATVQAERSTYYFYWRIFETFFSYSIMVGNHSISLPDPVADGLRNQRIHWRNATSFRDAVRHVSPFYLTAEKDDGRVMVIIRGTLYEDEWRRDLIFGFANVSETSQYFDGQVHRGTFLIFREVVEHVIADLEARRPKEVTFSGHSLGGTLALYLSAALARRWEGRGVSINAVTFAAVTPGDRIFWESMRQKVNVRNIRYLGEGEVWQDGKRMYTLGDVVPQAPHPYINQIPNCPATTDPGNPGLPNEYWAIGHAVAFYPSNLRNAKEWRKRSDMLDLSNHRNVDNHHCAYTCWVTDGVGDPETRCRFPDSQRETIWSRIFGGTNQVPAEEVCETAWLLDELEYFRSSAVPYTDPQGAQP